MESSHVVAVVVWSRDKGNIYGCCLTRKCLLKVFRTTNVKTGWDALRATCSIASAMTRANCRHCHHLIDEPIKSNQFHGSCQCPFTTLRVLSIACYCCLLSSSYKIFGCSSMHANQSKKLARNTMHRKKSRSEEPSHPFHPSLVPIIRTCLLKVYRMAPKKQNMIPLPGFAFQKSRYAPAPMSVSSRGTCCEPQKLLFRVLVCFLKSQRRLPPSSIAEVKRLSMLYTTVSWRCRACRWSVNAACHIALLPKLEPSQAAAAA